jgi:DNA-binding NarL/FixJ family response regulator
MTPPREALDAATLALRLHAAELANIALHDRMERLERYVFADQPDRKSALVERNARIVARYEAGEDHAVIASSLGLYPSTVRAIVRLAMPVSA